jgi:hypothetical protein
MIPVTEQCRQCRFWEPGALECCGWDWEIEGEENMSDRLGDAPIQPELEEIMNKLALGLDRALNEPGEKTNGFVLLVFPLAGREGRCNYISNAQRSDVITLLKEQLARFEGMPEAIGRA